jgi:hypothetical protein
MTDIAGLDAAHAATGAPAPDFRRLVGAAGWMRLPQEVRRRFATDHASVRYPGRMTLWCSAVGWLCAALAKLFGGPLPLGRATDALAEVLVHADGRGGVVWDRALRPAGGAPLRVRSTKRLGDDGDLLECVDGGFGMVLAVTEEAGALVFTSRSYFLGHRWRLPLPGLLTPGRCRVVHRSLGPRAFRFELEMVHPLWGATFRQTGVFTDPEG